MRNAYLAFKQAGYNNRVFWRNPASPFFTFVFPIMFLVVFNLLFKSNDIDVPGGKVNTATFYVPGIAALSIISACYTNVAMSIVFSRDGGILKRVRGTPLPSGCYLSGYILQAIWVSIILIVIIMAMGIVLYGVHFDIAKLPALVVTLVVGAFCFNAMALAISGFVPNEDAAPAMVNASILPLMFVSNVFIPTSSAPAWLNDVASFFPIAPLANALHACFNPFVTGSAFRPDDLLVLIAWGAAATLIALRFFSWEPRR